jgi:probable phosphoglycerate mutase
MKRVLLVRHGESAWNASRRLQGQADIALSARGEEQARLLRPVIAALEPDKVVCSDLARARKTAELLGYADALPDEALREIDVGDWTGEAIPDLITADAEAYSGWRAGTYTPPRGESWPSFQSRVTASLQCTLASGAERMLVVCHGGVIRALLDKMIGLPPHRILPVGPASLTVLADKNGGMRLEAFNFTPSGLSLGAPD